MKGLTTPVEVKIKTNFSALLDELAKQKGLERITTTYVSRELPMSYVQASKLRADKLTRIDLLTLQKTLNFFERHGMEVGFQDLFTYKETAT
ncbi:MAG: hypothetical protein ACPGWR_05130 [Ardenticatenaceae bacterium]